MSGHRIAARVACGVILGSWTSTGRAQIDEPPRPEIERLIAALGEVVPSPTAGARLVELGDEAVPALVLAVLESEDLLTRGRAVLCLLDIEGAGALEALERLTGSHLEPDLVRVWATAARIRRADEIDRLLELGSFITRDAALIRPWVRRLTSLVPREQIPQISGPLLELCGWLEPKQARPIVDLVGRGELLAIMLDGRTPRRARQAAEWLGALHDDGQQVEVAREMLAALRFDPAAETPWQGALFLPRVVWTRDTNLALIEELLRWGLQESSDGERLQEGPETVRTKQVLTAVVSLVATEAGTGIPRFAGMHDALRAWARVAGAPVVRALMKKHGLSLEPDSDLSTYLDRLERDTSRESAPATDEKDLP